jgi:hypothetical protein
VDHDAAGRQRQGDAPGADAQLQGPAAASKLRQDVGRRVCGAGAELLRPLVVGRRGTFSEVAVLIVHRRTVPQKTSAGLACFACSGRVGRAHCCARPPSERWLVDVFWIGGSFGTVAVLALLAALRRRWDVLRDLTLAAGGALAVSGILVLVLGAAGGRPRTRSTLPVTA